MTPAKTSAEIIRRACAHDMRLVQVFRRSQTISYRQCRKCKAVEAGSYKIT